MADIALLAPVHEYIVESGEATCHETGHVCFGSNAWEVFGRLDREHAAETVPVYIYASHVSGERRKLMRVTWKGTYAGSVSDSAGKLDEEEGGHRPEVCTQPDSGESSSGWGVLWKVQNLHRLDDEAAVPISKFRSLRTGEFHANAPPRGPQLVRCP